ncbi:hypothetical protein CPB84DRAFT_1751434 [Gymnopilus junonius]|uniref:Uncharacterized protein n=1 Tax=Gymnopilus junonius TaxID=109634 RepID=A0A9P5TIH9_GYMJU|nr:hypothetical protein CPB84DRAFT_1751434 [Gymnopilus junonius]
MLFILIFLYFYQGGIEATPLTILRRQNVPDLASACICHNTRSLWDVIWSCTATIFACSWVSVHPNIPEPGETRINKALQRLELMFWSIITPEMIIGWTMRQWWGARKLEATYQGNTPDGILYPDDLQRLLQEGKIQMPLISEADIQDRSKGDGLAKALVIVQTSWFFLTHLELVTLALAVLNGIMYFLWWHKPLDVQSNVPVYLLEVHNNEATADSAVDNKKLGNERNPPLSTESLPPIVLPQKQRWYYILYNILLTLLRAVWWCVTGFLWRWPAAVAWRALLRMGDMLHSEKLDLIDHSELEEKPHALGIREKLHAGLSDTFRNALLQIPTCYAFKADDTPTRNFLGMTAFIATVFGAIHCAGWYFTSSTTIELSLGYDRTSMKLLDKLETVLSSVLILAVPFYMERAVNILKCLTILALSPLAKKVLKSETPSDFQSQLAMLYYLLSKFSSPSNGTLKNSTGRYVGPGNVEQESSTIMVMDWSFMGIKGLAYQTLVASIAQLQSTLGLRD